VRVVRVFQKGVGVSFLKPSPEIFSILASASNKAGYSTSVSQTPKGSHSPTLISRDLENNLVEIAKLYLTVKLNEFMKIGADRLIRYASKARSISEESQFLKAADVLKGKSGEDFLKSFLARLGKSPGKRKDTKTADDANSLELLNDDTFEEWLAVSNIVGQAETRHRRILDNLEKSFELVTTGGRKDSLNPFSPQALTQIFQNLLSPPRTSTAAFRELCSVFGLAVLNNLGPLYQEIQTTLDPHTAPLQLNVSKKIPYQPIPKSDPPPQKLSPTPQKSVQNNNAQFGESAARISASETTNSIPLNPFFKKTVSSPLTHDLEENPLASLQNILSLFAESVRDDTDISTSPNIVTQSSSIDRRVGPIDRRIGSEEEILAAIRLLREEREGHSPNSEMPHSLVARLENRLSALVGSSVHLTPRLRSAGEVIENLFRELARDDRVDDITRRWLQRLETAVLSVALRDNSLFQIKDHPVRRFLDQFGKLGEILQWPGDNSVERLLEKAIEDLESSTTVSEEVLTGLNKINARQELRYNTNVERLRKELEGAQRLREAKISVRKAIANQFPGDQVPKVIVMLLESGWNDLLVHVYLRNGTRDPTWEGRISLLGKLYITLQKKAGSVSEQEIQTLLRRIDDGLDFIGTDPLERRRVRIELFNALQQIPVSLATFVSLPATDDQKGDIAHSDEHGDSYINDQLQIGDTILSCDTELKRQILRIAWIDREKNQFVLADANGAKVSIYNRHELRNNIDTGKLIPIKNRDLSFVEGALLRSLNGIQEKLRYSATHDGLTDLLNRREFSLRLEEILNQRDDSVVKAVIHLDLDRFRVLNNNFGQEAGDALLQEIAQLLRDRFPGKNELVSRLGDDEFCVLMIYPSAEVVQNACEELRQAVANLTFNWKGRPFASTTSIGLAIAKLPGDTADSLLKKASIACAVAKSAGRNCVRIYQADDVEIQRRNRLMEWVEHIDRALGEKKLGLRYQPIVSLGEKNSVAHHQEILLLLNDESGRPISPAEFIQAAEIFGRMGAVDRWVVNAVLQWVLDHPRTMQRLTQLAVNLSGQSLMDDNFLNFLINRFSETGVRPEYISFEVTETAAFGDFDRAVRFIERMKKLGCSFAIDDFGSGNASYAYLRRLPVDYVKIDGIFVRDMIDNPLDQAMVKSINGIAHLLGMKTIAEYASSQQIIDMLSAIGIDYAQGYAISPPLPLPDDDDN